MNSLKDHNFNLLNDRVCNWEIIRVKNFDYPLYIALEKTFRVTVENGYIWKVYYKITMHPIITYKTISKMKDEKEFNSNTVFGVEIYPSSKTANFSIEKGIIINPSKLRGRGIGSYMLSDIIEWARSHFPEYEVIPLTLGPADADTEEAKISRNRFYRNFNFKLQFNDEQEVCGKALADRLDNLKAHRNYEKTEPVNIVTFINEIIRENIKSSNKILELENIIESKKDCLNDADKKIKSKNYYISFLFVIISALILFLNILWKKLP